MRDRSRRPSHAELFEAIAEGACNAREVTRAVTREFAASSARLMQIFEEALPGGAWAEPRADRARSRGAPAPEQGAEQGRGEDASPKGQDRDEGAAGREDAGESTAREAADAGDDGEPAPCTAGEDVAAVGAQIVGVFDGVRDAMSAIRRVHRELAERLR